MIHCIFGVVAQRLEQRTVNPQKVSKLTCPNSPGPRSSDVVFRLEMSEGSNPSSPIPRSNGHY
jgi:hypothetical protein